MLWFIIGNPWSIIHFWIFMVNKPSSWGIPWGIPHPLTPGCWPIPTTWPSPAPLWCFAEPARRGRWGASAWRTRKKRVRGIHRIAGTNIMTFMYLILYYVYIMYIIYIYVCNYIEYHFREREREIVCTYMMAILFVCMVGPLNHSQATRALSTGISIPTGTPEPRSML